MKATVSGQYLAAEPTRSGKGSMLSVLQDNSSCELYLPKEVEIPKLERLDDIVIVAVIRPGFEGRGFQASVQSIAKAASLSTAKTA